MLPEQLLNYATKIFKIENVWGTKYQFLLNKQDGGIILSECEIFYNIEIHLSLNVQIIIALAHGLMVCRPPNYFFTW